MLPCWLIDNQLCYYYINEPDEIGGRSGVEPCPPVLQTGALPRELVGRLVNKEGWSMAEGGECQLHSMSFIYLVSGGGNQILTWREWNEGKSNPYTSCLPRFSRPLAVQSAAPSICFLEVVLPLGMHRCNLVSGGGN